MTQVAPNLDWLFQPERRPQPGEILVDRSSVETYLACPLQEHLDGITPRPDADLDRLANVGIEFHRIMHEYLDSLIAEGSWGDPERLIVMVRDGDPALQPDLNFCAKLTAPRIRIYPTSHLGHERQAAYRLEHFGPRGEDVLLTCRADLLSWGDEEGELRITDWKTGWKKSGHEFQAAFYATVHWRAIEGVTSVKWCPFYCRFGSWGRPYEFQEADIEEAEATVKAAVMKCLADDEHKPTPGLERCRLCRHQEVCPAQRTYGDIDADPKGFAAATEKLETELDHRKAAMKAYAEAHGPIKTEAGWWGVNPINQRPSFRFNKGGVDFMEADE